MTLYIPISPETGGAMLDAYIAADPSRRPVFDNIKLRLEEAGGLGTIARYYVTRCAHRRAVLRGILITTQQRIPGWLCEDASAAHRNRRFILHHRKEYLAFRQSMRLPDGD